MGKGDIKSKRGNISNGSYGKTREKKASVPTSASVKPVKAKVEKLCDRQAIS